MLCKRIILGIGISVSNYKNLKKLLENVKLRTSASEALWLIYVCVWEKVRCLILSICFFLMGQSFLHVLASDTACYLIIWRFLLAGARVKAKTCQRTWILVTLWWLEMCLPMERVEKVGHDMSSLHGWWSSWKTWITLKWRVTSKSCSTVLHRGHVWLMPKQSPCEKTSTLHKVD